MPGYRDLSANSAIAKLKMDITRLVILRSELEKGALFHLKEFSESLDEGNIKKSISDYHALASALICGGYRRVSGDLILDMIMHLLLLSEHPFALMAARCEMDEALYAAMRSELSIMQSLSTLDDETLLRLISDRHQDIKSKNRQFKDNAAALATAAWGGGTAKQIDANDTSSVRIQIPVTLPTGEQTALHYGEAALRDEMVADDALSEMYNRFMDTDDWRALVDVIWNFHASYGSGVFLRSRYLAYENGFLHAIEEPEKLPEPYAQAEYECALNNLVSFMRGRTPHHMAIYGPRGNGKTSFVLSLAEELPELRIIIIKSFDRSSFTKLMDRLSKQPLRFMILLDDMPDDALLGMVSSMLPKNILIAATMEHKPASSLLSLEIELGYIAFGDFAAMVEDGLNCLNMDYNEQKLFPFCEAIEKSESGLTLSSIKKAQAAILFKNELTL